MAFTLPDVTDAELALLQSLWSRGALSVRQLAEEHYPPAASSGLATVQKLLERLESKGFVIRSRPAGVQLFQAQVSKEELIGRRLRGVAEQLCEGSYSPLLTHLVENERLTAKERRELRRLLEKLTQPK